MSNRLRAHLVWILVIVFLVGTPILIGYSQGYRFGDALSLINTGGIYLHADLPHTEVYLDGELVQSRGYFIRNTYVQNLRSNKTYEVWVEREGYQSWVKMLTVRPKLVTEARVLMLPDTFEWQPVTASTTLPLDANATTTNATSTTVANPAYVELERYFEEQGEQFLVEVATTTFVMVRGKTVATTTTILLPEFPNWLEDVASSTNLAKKNNVRERDGVLTWLEDGNVHALWARENDPPPFYFCNATCTPEYVIDWTEDISHFEFYPSRSDVLIIGSERGVYAVELDGRSQRNVQVFIEEPGLTFKLRQNGRLVVYDGKEFRETNW